MVEFLPYTIQIIFFTTVVIMMRFLFLWLIFLYTYPFSPLKHTILFSQQHHQM